MSRHRWTRRDLPGLLLAAIVLAAPVPAAARSAEEVLAQEHYSAYVGLLNAYYPPGDARKTFYREINRLMGDFERIRRKVKMREPFKMKIATLAPMGTVWVSIPSDVLVPLLKDLSAGMMGITLYAGGLMGEDRDILRKMKVGQLQGCGCSGQGLFSAVPELSVFSLPFLYRNMDEVDYIFTTFRPDIESLLEKKGLILYSLIDTGWFHAFTKNSVATLADLKAQTFAAWFGDTETAFFREWGVIPIPLPVPEIVAALRSGIVNAMISPAGWILGSQAFLEFTHVLEAPIAYSPAVIVLDKNSLVAEGMRCGLTRAESVELVELPVRLNSLLKVEAIWKTMLREFDRKAMDSFRERGMKQIPLRPGDLEALEQAGRRAWDACAGTVYPRTLLNRITAALDKYRTRPPARF